MKKIVSLSIVLSLLALPNLALSQEQKIIFASCGNQTKPMPILDAINKEQADLFIFLGDNVYGDTEDMDLLADKYKQLGSIPGIKTLKENTEVIAIWDDHDYGENDAGIEYAKKEESRQIMLDFFNEDKNSIRRTRSDGIYTSYMYGEAEQKVQVILPDLRWNRSKLAALSKSEYQNIRKPLNMGPYKIHKDSKASMLGESQWDWLEIQLQKPSKIKIIGSSLQLLPEFTGWESWANYPEDRARLMDLIQQYQVNGIIIVSGDTHWGEVSKVDNLIDYPLWEITSSGLTEKWKHVSPNSHRVGNFTNQVNYGEILIDWHKKDPSISFGLKDIGGKVTHRHQVMLSEISPYKI
ncbi:alkaline phosphatase family protein [Pseudoalteromonas sp. C2R02]|uniref:alkaline phosphatase D family protein n=1 Tax=Pseudoalteromonas sp. C2R02 TaxID=2841565 RepID=UPI001C083901|nr:alkaline phosphatase D family protein [Pseudoalteromonas sp. C2R02]MBU2970686.1 alkaline phosphatase family protein [Pseudoalteromonas sp. C2R02]